MALENCLQLSTVCTTRVGAVQCHHTFSFKEKLKSPTFQKGPKKSSGYSNLTINTRKPLFVCKAREALNQGNLCHLCCDFIYNCSYSATISCAYKWYCIVWLLSQLFKYSY